MSPFTSRALVPTVLLTMVWVGCGSPQEESNDPSQMYQKQVVALEDELLDRVARMFDREDPSAKDDPRIITDIWLDATSWGAAELRVLNPPQRYARGHRMLLDYYEEQLRGLHIKKRVLGRQGRELPTADLERELEQSIRRVLMLREEAIDELPFLRGIEVEIGSLQNP